MRQDREKHQKSLISNFKNNPKRFYGYLRNVQAVKSTVCHLRDGDGSLTDSDTETADILCAHTFIKCLLVMMLRA